MCGGCEFTQLKPSLWMHDIDVRTGSRSRNHAVLNTVLRTANLMYQPQTISFLFHDRTTGGTIFGNFTKEYPTQMSLIFVGDISTEPHSSVVEILVVSKAEKGQSISLSSYMLRNKSDSLPKPHISCNR